MTAQGEGAVVLTGQAQEIVIDIAVAAQNGPHRPSAVELLSIGAGCQAALQPAVPELPCEEEEIKGRVLR